MNNDDHIPHLNKSSSYNPIYIQNTLYLSISALKNKQDSNLLNRLNKNRRKSIIPLSHLPTKSYKIFEMDNESDNSLNKNYSLEETEKQFQSNTNTTSTSQTNNNYDNNDLLPIEKNKSLINKEVINNENSFDVFILQNFTPFSGEQDVNLWLHDTQKRFDRFLIPRNLRFTAIPLLVEGPADKVYILNRQNIQSFDDFYEILLLHFDKNDVQSTHNNQQENIISQSDFISQTKSSDDKNLQTMLTFDDSHLSERPPKHQSTALIDNGAAFLTGEIPALQSTVANNNTTANNISNIDEPTNILCKVLPQTLTKNPKTLKDNKNDIQKSVSGIEYHSDTTYVPHFNRLDFSIYLLRLDIVQWYKHNKILSTSWDVFVYKKRKKTKRLSTNVYGKNSYAEWLGGHR
ncbi:unnamed protein product [Rotaria sp. Silwood2]|nr:unnamed protein product [Rotaria sp. Silwood2]CAF4582830.1 unnamed protein product [Rotaria sp. Silwood2]